MNHESTIVVDIHHGHEVHDWTTNRSGHYNR